MAANRGQALELQDALYERRDYEAADISGTRMERGGQNAAAVALSLRFRGWNEHREFSKTCSIDWRPRRDLNPCYRRERRPINRRWSAIQHSEVHRNTSQETQDSRQLVPGGTREANSLRNRLLASPGRVSPPRFSRRDGTKLSLATIIRSAPPSRNRLFTFNGLQGSETLTEPL